MSVKHKVYKYKTLVFDCDGVILNSNKVKSNAFYQTTLPYGKAAAKAMLEYHIEHGGISRYEKFTYFLDKIMPSTTADIGPGLEQLLKNYANIVKQGLLGCEIAQGLYELREYTKHAKWLIVSGGDQAELRDLFARRDISNLFDGGIFGSPDNKDIILSREKGNGNIQHPALFLGDSKYDYQAANTAGLDFIFLTSWTEVDNLELWISNNSITHFSDIQSMTVSQSRRQYEVYDSSL